MESIALQPANIQLIEHHVGPPLLADRFEFKTYADPNQFGTFSELFGSIKHAFICAKNEEIRENDDEAKSVVLKVKNWSDGLLQKEIDRL